MLRNAVAEHRVSHGLEHAEAVDPPLDLQRQALTGMLVDEGHDPEAPSVMGSTLNNWSHFSSIRESRWSRCCLLRRPAKRTSGARTICLGPSSGGRLHA